MRRMKMRASILIFVLAICATLTTTAFAQGNCCVIQVKPTSVPVPTPVSGSIVTAPAATTVSKPTRSNKASVAGTRNQRKAPPAKPQLPSNLATKDDIAKLMAEVKEGNRLANENNGVLNDLKAGWFTMDSYLREQFTTVGASMGVLSTQSAFNHNALWWIYWAGVLAAIILILYAIATLLGFTRPAVAPEPQVIVVDQDGNRVLNHRVVV